MREFPGCSREETLVVPGGLHELKRASRESGEAKAARVHRTEYKREKSA